jgi:HD-like signal output (HDOD) protein
MVNLDELIYKAQELQPLPASVVRLANLAESPETDLDEITEVISYDQALTGRLLRAANSAASASATPIRAPREAMFRLGTARVLALAIASSVNTFLQRDATAYGLSEGQLWRHSVAAAVVAETLPEFTIQDLPTETFAAALLHDIGKLVMGRFLNREDLEFLRRAQSDGGLDPLAAEIQVLRVHHGELGGIVAQHWALPERIVKGIIYHHEPAAGLDVIADAIYLANLVAKTVENEEATLDIGEDSLDRLGLAGSELPQLVTMARSRYASVSSRYNAA